jgi:hypothetical protein
MSVAYDPFIDQPEIGNPNPELKWPTSQQKAVLALVAVGYVILVLAFLFSLIGEQ